MYRRVIARVLSAVLAATMVLSSADMSVLAASVDGGIVSQSLDQSDIIAQTLESGLEETLVEDIEEAVSEETEEPATETLEDVSEAISIVSIEEQEQTTETIVEDESESMEVCGEEFKDTDGLVWDSKSGTIIVRYEGTGGAITLPAKTTKIADKAFYGAPITSVDMSGCSKLLSIGDNAFNGCSSMKNAILPNSLTTIGAAAFAYCYALEDITIPASVTKIKTGAFASDRMLTGITINASVFECEQSIFHDANINRIVFNSSKITSIPDYIFSGAGFDTANLRLVIPKQVTRIGKRAFAGSGIKYISFEEGSALNTIDEFAFEGCGSLEGITLPASLKTIGESSFRGTGIRNIVIPANVEYIGLAAFNDCPSLTGIDVESTKLGLNSCRNAYNGADGTYFAGGGTITSLVLADGMNCIPNGMFHDVPFSSGLVVNIPDTVTEIGMGAFDADHLPEASIGGVILGNKLTTIGNKAFKNCSNIDSVTFPNTLTAIGDNAFEGCTSIQSVVIPSNVTSIGGYAFYNCSALKTLRFDACKSGILCGGGIFKDCKLSEVRFSQKLTYIPENLFYNAGFLDSFELHIPSQITFIGEKAICSPDQGPRRVIFDGNNVKTIGKWNFQGCNNADFTKLIIPEGVVRLDPYVGEGCRMLEEVVLPNSLKEMAEWDFSNNSNLKSVYFGDNLASIEYAPRCFSPASSPAPLINFYLKKGSTTDKTLKEAGYYNNEGINVKVNYISNWLTYKLNGGSCNISQRTYEAGDVIYLDTPVKEGYTFLGWYVDGVKLDSSSYSTAGKSGEITFEAKWKAISSRVTLDVNGGNPLDKTVYTVTYNATYADAIDNTSAKTGLPVPVKDGFKFAGWNTSDDGSGDRITNASKVTIYEDITLYAMWTPYSYTIKYNANGGSGTMANSTGCKSGQPCKLRACSYALREYNFNGWNTKPDGTGTAAYLDNGAWYINYDAIKDGDVIILYAQWKGTIRKIDFDVNGGSALAAGDRVRYVACGDRYITAYDENGDNPESIAMPVPSKAGSVFVGWFDEDGVKHTDDEKVLLAADSTFTAYWKTSPAVIPAVEADTAAGEVFAGTRIKLSESMNGALIYYTIGGSTPVVSDAGKEINPSGTMLYEDAIVLEGDAGDNITIKAIAYKDGTTSSVAGYTYTIKPVENPDGDVTAQDKALVGTIPSGYWVVASCYDKLDPTMLCRKVWEAEQTSGSELVMRQTGAAIKVPNLTVYYGNRLLTENVDYTVAYTNNVKAAAFDAVNNRNVSIAPTVKITGKGNYVGAIVRTFTIVNASEEAGAGNVATRLAADKVSVELSVDEGNTYTANLTTTFANTSIEPLVKVTYLPKTEKIVLTEGTHYYVTYSNNTNASKKAMVTVTGMGMYYGVINKTFTISPINLATVAADSVHIDYIDKNPGKDGYQVIYSKKNQAAQIVSGVSIDGIGTPLDLAKDVTVKYAYDKRKSVSTVSITGKGNYKGTYAENPEIEITGRTLSDATVTYASQILKVMNKKGVYGLNLVVKDSEGNKLTAGNQYTVTYRYADNDAEITGADYVNSDRIVIATIAGVEAKNYTGSKEISFKYIPNYNFASQVSITAGNVNWQDKAGICKPGLAVKNSLTGKALKAGKDYESLVATRTEYCNFTYAEETYVNQIVNKKRITVFRDAGDTVKKADIIPVGAKITVSVKGKGSYSADTITADFYYTYNIAKATVKVADQTYTGNEICPLKDAVTITYKLGKTTVTVPKSSYNIAGYGNNIKQGKKARLTITGLGDYSGTRNVNFKIIKKAIL